MPARKLLAPLPRRAPWQFREGVLCGGIFPHHARPYSMRLSPSVLPTITAFSGVLSTAPPHLQILSAQLRISETTNFTSRHHYSTGKMSASAPPFSKTTTKPGNGKDFPKVGQKVTMEYTGWLYDPSKPNNKGDQFDSSVGRGGFQTEIGVGRVIQGWDQGVPQMSLGEQATLIIPGHMAYGARGFPGLIPPNATLLFDVELKHIY